MNAVMYFEIQAAEPERAMSFYESVFGWRFAKREELPIPYWRIETAGIHGGLLARPAASPSPESGTNAYVCTMAVADFDATATGIEAAGGLVALPKFALPGHGWQGYFLDPEGNTFGVFQADEAAY